MPLPAVILLSGGLDSATAGAMARAEGFELFALSVDYGQRHRCELEAAGRVAKSLGVKRHVTLRIDLAQFGGSALTADVAVPKGRSDEEMAAGIPVTYVPARNTVFLSLALAYAEVLGAADLFLGRSEETRLNSSHLGRSRMPSSAWRETASRRFRRKRQPAVRHRS